MQSGNAAERLLGVRKQFLALFYDAFNGGIAFEELEVVYADLLWL